MIKMNAVLESDIKKPVGMTHFLKAYYNGKTVKELKAQESFRLSSFAKSNCLIELKAEQSEFKAGEEVEIHLLPSF
jgi:molybdopterin molybdotransferase